MDEGGRKHFGIVRYAQSMSLRHSVANGQARATRPKSYGNSSPFVSGILNDPDVDAIAKIVLSDPRFAALLFKRLASMLVAGSNVDIEPNATNDTLTISAGAGGTSLVSVAAGPGVSTSTNSNTGVTTVSANLTSGQGISLTQPGNGSVQIASNFVAGAGILFSAPDPTTGTITISTASLVLAGQGVNVQSTGAGSVVSANILASTGISIDSQGNALAIATNLVAGDNVTFTTDSGGGLHINAIPAPVYAFGAGISISQNPSTATTTISTNLVAGPNVTLTTNPSTQQITVAASMLSVAAGAGIAVSAAGNVSTVSTNLVAAGSVSLSTNASTGQITVSVPTISAGAGMTVTTTSNVTTVAANLVGAGNVTLTTNGSTGQITVSAPTLAAGNGVTLSTASNVTTVTANLTAGTGIGITASSGALQISSTLEAGPGLTAGTDGTTGNPVFSANITGTNGIVATTGSTNGSAVSLQLAPLDTLVEASTTSGNQLQVAGGATSGAPITLYVPSFSFNTAKTISITTWTVVSTANPVVSVGTAVWTLTNQLLAPGLARLSWTAKSDFSFTLASSGTAWNTGFSVATASSNVLAYLPSVVEGKPVIFQDTTISATQNSDIQLNTNGTITFDFTFMQNVFALGVTGAQAIAIMAGTFLYATAATTP